MWVSLSHRPSHSATAAWAAFLREAGAEFAPQDPPSHPRVVDWMFGLELGLGWPDPPAAGEPGRRRVGGCASTLLRCESTEMLPTPGARGVGVIAVPGAAGAVEPAPPPPGAARARRTATC